MDNRKGSRDHQVPSSLALLPFAEVLTEEGRRGLLPSPPPFAEVLTEEGTGGLLALQSQGRVPSSVATLRPRSGQASGPGGGSGWRPLHRRGDSIQRCFDAVTHVIVREADNGVAFQLTIARGPKWPRGRQQGCSWTQRRGTDRPRAATVREVPHLTSE